MEADVTDELGPIDFVVVEFPPGVQQFSGKMADELAVLVEAELVRILDILIIVKDEQGNVGAIELDELDPVEGFRRVAEELTEVLAEADVDDLAASMTLGTTAGVVIWENTWAAPFAGAVREAGGRIVADDRIPAHVLLSVIGIDETDRIL